MNVCVLPKLNISLIPNFPNPQYEGMIGVRRGNERGNLLMGLKERVTQSCQSCGL